MIFLIKVNFTNQTKEVIPKLKDLTKLVKLTIDREHLKRVEVSIILITDQRMRLINHQYRKINKTTDILSFSLNDELTLPFAYDLFGDIYISMGQAKKQALASNTSLFEELSYLLVHGVLHLLGYDHDNDKNKKIMDNKQEAIINEFITKK